MKSTNKKLINSTILILALILLLSTIAYAKPFTEAFRGGLVQINDFFANEQYKAYAKAIDFFFFSLLFISIYMMGVRYAFKEVKKPEKVIAILLGLMTAFLLVLGGFSATILLPYIHWILYLLLFYFYWWLLKGIKSKFWRFILALLLTLLTIGLAQGLFGAFAPDTEGFFKSLAKSFEGIQFPEMPGVPDWTRDLFGAPTSVATGPTTLPPTITPTAEKESWYKTWHWLWLLIIPAFFAIRRLMGGPREPTRPTPPTTRDQIISKIKEIINNKRASKDKLQELAREIDQLIQQGDTKQGFIAKLTETEEQDIANLFLDTSRRLEELVEGNVKKLIVKIREFFQELIKLKVVEEDIYGLIRESTPNTPSAWVRSILAIVADDKKSQVNGFVYLLQVLIAQNVKEADIPQQYRAENVPRHSPIERKGIFWLIAYCFNIERKETILAKTLANLFEQSHIQDLVKGRFKQAITNEQHLEAYHQREKIAVVLLLTRVAKQIELMERFIAILEVTPTGPVKPRQPEPTKPPFEWRRKEGEYDPTPPVEPVLPIKPVIPPPPKPGPTRHKDVFVDLSSQFMPAKNQNKSGACAAFAGTSIVEYYLNIFVKSIKEENELSELFLYYNIRPDPMQRGVYTHALGDVPASIQLKGICFSRFWEWLPLDENDVPTKISRRPQDDAYVDAYLKRITGWKPLSPNDPDSWVDELLKYNPIFIAINADAAFKKAGDEKKNIYFTQSGVGGGHAIVIVGFSNFFPDPYDPKKAIAAFKIRNSWGSDWGENGYIWVPHELLPTLLINEPFVFERLKGTDQEPKKEKLHTLILTPTNSKPDGPIEIVGIYHDAYSKEDHSVKIGKGKEKEKFCEIVLADTTILEELQARIFFFKYREHEKQTEINKFKIEKQDKSKAIIKINGKKVEKSAFILKNVKTLQINEYEFRVEVLEKPQEIIDRQSYLTRFDDKILKLRFQKIGVRIIYPKKEPKPTLFIGANVLNLKAEAVGKPDTVNIIHKEDANKEKNFKEKSFKFIWFLRQIQKDKVREIIHYGRIASSSQYMISGHFDEGDADLFVGLYNKNGNLIAYDYAKAELKKGPGGKLVSRKLEVSLGFFTTQQLPEKPTFEVGQSIPFRYWVSNMTNPLTERKLMLNDGTVLWEESGQYSFNYQTMSCEILIPGEYKVTVFVKDSKGREGTASVNVIIKEKGRGLADIFPPEAPPQFTPPETGIQTPPQAQTTTEAAENMAAIAERAMRSATTPQQKAELRRLVGI